MANKDEPNFNLNFGHFKTVTEKGEEFIESKQKAKNTSDATKFVDELFYRDYLIEKGLPNPGNISDEQLSKILQNFYCELSKKKVNPHDLNGDNKYKTSSLRCMRGQP